MDENGFIAPEQFAQGVSQMILKIRQTQYEAIHRAARLVYDAVKNDRRFYVTGTGHSHMVAEEMYVRAGGLAVVTPMLPPEFMLHNHPHKSTWVERLTDYADVIMQVYPVAAGDVMLIVSNSGRNNLPVELVLRAQAAGAKVIAITSVEGMKNQLSRHPCGKKLADLADVVIDNCGVEGDSMCDIGCEGIHMGSTSSITGTYISQELGMAVADLYIKDGIVPPVFCSGNIDGAEKRNKKIRTDYYNA